MWKKRAAAVLALVMAGASLAACGGGDDSGSGSSGGASSGGTSSKAEVSSDSTTTGDDGREMVGNMYVSGLPVVKEKETFSLFCDDNGKPEDLIMYPILEEQTNVHVDLMLYPYEIAKEKKNILLNSGDYPDAIGGWVMSEEEMLTDGMVDGLYIDIKDMIEKYAPVMRDQILEVEGVRQTMTLPDGSIRAIPYIIKAPLVPYLPWINVEWLEKVGKEMPTTTDEFADVLRAFKTQDPNGNGKADEIPLSTDKDNLNFGLYAGYWGTACPPKYFTMKDGELIFGANTDAYKEAMKWLGGLYKEGLIDPEAFTHDKTQWKAKGNQDLYGVSMAYGSRDFAAEGLQPYEPTAFKPVPVLTAPGVDKPSWQRDCNGASILKYQLAITDKAKNPATIVRWYDNVFDVDNSIQIQAGLFDKRLKKLGEGDYQYMDESLLTEEERTKYGWANMFTQSLPKFIPLEIEIKQAEGIPYLEDEKKAADEMYEPFLNEATPQAWATAEESDRISVLFTDIDNYVKEKTAAWVSGQSDPEADWDAYLAQLEKLGLPELMEIRRNAISKLVD